MLREKLHRFHASTFDAFASAAASARTADANTGATIGIDLLGTLIERPDDRTLRTPRTFTALGEVSGAVDALRALHAATAGRITLFTRASTLDAQLVDNWCTSRDVWARIGIEEHRVEFVATDDAYRRLVHERRLTHCIDDRPNGRTPTPSALAMHRVANDTPHHDSATVAVRNWHRLRAVIAADVARLEPDRTPLPMRAGVRARAFVTGNDDIAILAFDHLMQVAHLAVLHDGAWLTEQPLPPDPSDTEIPESWVEIGSTALTRVASLCCARRPNGRELQDLAAGRSVQVASATCA